MCESYEDDEDVIREIGEPGRYDWDDYDEEWEDWETDAWQVEEHCSMCGRDDEPMQDCEVCGQWICNHCVMQQGMWTRVCPTCAKGDGLREEFPF